MGNPEQKNSADTKVDTKQELQKLQEKMPLLEAQIIEKAKAHLQEKLGERKVETKGEYVQFQSPRFQELIGFIQGHPDDHPGNATMQPEDVKHIVTLTPEGDSGAVVAMNDQYELLGFAD